MKITAWRITPKKYLDQAFTGDGAKTWGGRWNPIGQPAVYCAQSLSLAILELIVHLEDHSDISRYVGIPVSFSSKSVYTLSILPATWPQLPIGPESMAAGKKWLDEKKFPVLKVPSTIVHLENNFVLNPLHPGFSKFKIGKPQNIYLDPRIVNLLEK